MLRKQNNVVRFDLFICIFLLVQLICVFLTARQSRLENVQAATAKTKQKAFTLIYSLYY